MLARESFAARLVAIGDRSLLPGLPDIEHVALKRPRVAGRLDPANSRYVLEVLDRAGTPMPLGWAVDKTGRGSNDPKAVLDAMAKRLEANA